MFASTIDNKAIDNLPYVTLNGKIQVVTTQKQLDKALEYLSACNTVGFDTETKPRFSAGKMYRPAILQLSTPEMSYVIHLKKVGLPENLSAFLSNPSVIKVGAAVRDDIIGLQRYAPFTPGGFTDLQDMAQQYGIAEKSVRKLSAIVLGKRVSKTQQTTNWETYPLSEAQLQYAATDSYVCLKIYQTLLANEQEKKTPKERMYEETIRQAAALIDPESGTVTNLANMAALLKETFHFWWVGFYLADKQKNQLILGPFQGPPACTRIACGRGVCGTAWKKGETIVVPDVEKFPGHIACSSRSRSEIVVPLKNASGEFAGVLDIDSERLETFDKTDKMYLEELARLFEKFL